MKKFTNIDNDSLNESKNLSEESSEISIDKLLGTLTIEVESNSESDVTIDYKIKANNKFYEGIKDYINQQFHKEKLELLEKARTNQFLHNMTWIDDEINAIRESQKK